MIEHPFMIKRLLLLSTMLLMGLSACSKSFTPQDFSKVKVGMESNQVSELLGKPASKEAKVILGRTSEIWRYQVKKATYTVTLLNGKVTTTSSSF